MENRKSAKELRVIAEGIRLVTLQELEGFGSGHIGGSMSIVETLAVLYGGELRCDPGNPKWEERDRLVLSKGHAGPALYATLSLRGFFPKEMLSELNQGGGHLPSHCDRNKTPGVDMTTGSLGQGISAAIGIALGNRMNKSDSITYLIIGDGECNEGQVWEGAMFAAAHKLSNLIAFVDWNKQQLDGFTKDILDVGDLADKFRAFGWFVQKVDGHDVGAILDAVAAAKEHEGAPSMIVLDTIKGYGTFAAGVEGNHHMSFTKDQMDEAVKKTAEKLEEARAAAAAEEAARRAAAAAEEAVKKAAEPPEEQPPEKQEEPAEKAEEDEAPAEEGEDNV
ncbi:transketolase [Sporobacter termitidis DSM 10068]|uniref:Transketolase n=1 Tax=Sporobacter termitidis DSM 10068 TaxID=1123282 RepID=A0A1M5Y420_9FIRM|nr:transketolase [Sporobacter termitidis]SHI06706.1 transketolase [Sporobacter termitidis DSM 10068]